MKNIFTDHPRHIGETYLEHLIFACALGMKMLIGGLVFIIHAIFPFLFQKTGSKILFNQTQLFVERMKSVDPHVLILSESIQNKAENNLNNNVLR